MSVYEITKLDQVINGEITLPGSKSISNRALIIRALCKDDFMILGLSSADDTKTISRLLNIESGVYDVGVAGTACRFLTAFLSIKDTNNDESVVLTGSNRMKQRPIGILVDALNQLGANIEYTEKKGYPPLKINPPKTRIGGETHELQISANVSSQYISALLLIAPTLPKGLQLTLNGKIVSRPYIQMTLNVMEYFGIKYNWVGNVISVGNQEYEARSFAIEADWSSASYYYGIAAMSDRCSLQLNGLFERSVQGDSVLKDLMVHFGVASTFNQNGVHLTKVQKEKQLFVYNFIECPDIAQTLAVVCGAVDVKGKFSGLETLRIKETDRITALQLELAKVGVSFAEVGIDTFTVEGKASADNMVQFKTYDDHRMAMSFSPFAMLLGTVAIENPETVTKSYPEYWHHLNILGFVINARNKVK